MEISASVKSDYELIDPSVQIDDLNIPKITILNAILKYGEMIKVQTNTKTLKLNYQTAYKRAKHLEKFKYERSTMGKRLAVVMENTYDIGQAYNIFIKFSLKVIRVLIDIANNQSWKTILTSYRAELIEIVNRRLIACVDLLEYCNELQSNVLNVLNPMIDLFNELGEQSDVRIFEIFLEKSKTHMSKETKNFIELGVKHKINLLVMDQIEKMDNIYQDIFEKRQKYIEEEKSFDKAICDWKNKAYYREGEVDF